MSWTGDERTGATSRPWPQQAWAWLLARPARMDVTLGVVLLLLTAVTLASQDTTLSGPQTGVAVAGPVVQALLLSRRRHAPVLVLGGCTGVLVLTMALTGDPVAAEFGVLFAVYAVALRRTPRVTWTAVAGSLAVVAVTSLLVVAMSPAQSAASPAERVATHVLGLLLAVLVALALGLTARTRREQVGALQERARQLALERDQREQLAAANERARMAREMHDVVAHSVAVMVTLAHGAAASLDRNPAGAREALRELGNTGRTALADTRRILGVLREEPDAGGPGSGGPSWQEHQDISALVDRFRQAGLPVRLVERGPDLPEDLPLRHAVYRIVQESLTNVLSHAPGSTAVDVVLDRGQDRVTAEIRNTAGRPAVAVPGRMTSGAGSGHGIAGMRERAALHLGSLEAGPTPTGWQVRAVLRYRDNGWA
jgi:signal transduction histidine kinase